LKVEVTSTISGYNFTFPDDKLQVSVSRTRVHTDGKITGDIRIILGKDKQEEPSFNFNFSSAQTRKQLIKSLDEKYPDWSWLGVVDEICRQVQALAMQGESSTVIKPTTTGAKHPGYYVEPIVMKGVPTVIYGDKGTNKTTLALTLMGLIACGINDSLTGLHASCSGKVGLLDWENNAELTDYTLSRLVDGGTLPYFELPYLRCNQPLADDIERIGRFLYENEIDVVMIDSLGQAAGSDRFDSAGKGSALRFFEAMRQFNLTSIIIGQNAKDDTGKRSIYGSTFFTYYARNIFRLQAGKHQDNEDEMLVALIHEESNFSKKYQPLGLRLAYTESTISVTSEVVSISQFLDRANQTKELLEFLKSGAKSVKAVSDYLNASANGTRVLLSRLKSRGIVVSLGAGMWGLKVDDDQSQF